MAGPPPVLTLLVRVRGQMGERDSSLSCALSRLRARRLHPASPRGAASTTLDSARSQVHGRTWYVNHMRATHPRCDGPLSSGALIAHMRSPKASTAPADRLQVNRHSGQNSHTSRAGRCRLCLQPRTRLRASVASPRPQDPAAPWARRRAAHGVARGQSCDTSLDSHFP